MGKGKKRRRRLVKALDRWNRSIEANREGQIETIKRLADSQALDNRAILERLFIMGTIADFGEKVGKGEMSAREATYELENITGLLSLMPTETLRRMVMDD